MIEKDLVVPEQKLAWWGDGPWVNEPDLIEFEHVGFKCIAARKMMWEGHQGFEQMSGGYLCGYVVIPEGHPWRSINDKRIFSECLNGIDIHGGVSWVGVLDGEEAYLIGFDCAHSHDISPSLERFQENLIRERSDEPWVKSMIELKAKYPLSVVWHKTYKDIDYVIDQCKSLAEQAKVAMK